MNNNLALKLTNVSKEYQIGTKKDGSLRGTLSSLFRIRNNAKESFLALNDVSFDVEKGDVVGIIGRNGAGKSTLLKILSQITRPTEGKIEVNGRIASLLEVGTGFHPELTGRENVFLNGTILGMTRKEVASKFDEIVAFSGIEKFIDTPVKHYSSGMYVRLAFAVAAHLEPEILIIDEVLAVGDAEFQKKCLGKMKDVAGEGRTVLFVSHQLGSIKMLCNKGILLEKGVLKSVGDIENIIQLYQKKSIDEVYLNTTSTKNVFLSKAQILNETNNFSHSELIEFGFELKKSTQNISIEDRILVRIFDELETCITSFESSISIKNNFTLKLPHSFLKRGNYYLNIILYRPAIEVYDNVNCCYFNVIDNNSEYAHLEVFDTGKVYSQEEWLN